MKISRAIKKLLKTILPSPLIRFICAVTRYEAQRDTPLATRYSGRDPSILQCYIAYNETGGFCVPVSSHHCGATQKIMWGKVYEEDTIDYIAKNCGKGDIIHAGAFFGDFLPALSRACKNGSKVWAFEPNPENYRCAKITMYINDIRNVELTNAALGLQEGVMRMAVSEENGTALGGRSHLVETVYESKRNCIDVRMVRIDDVIPADRSISILQLDVEGFEKLALTGSMSTIKKNRPILILETLPSEDFLKDNIFKLGYKVVGNVCDNTILKVG